MEGAILDQPALNPVPAPITDRLSPQNFSRLSSLIQQQSGIKMPPNKRTMLVTRLRSRLAALQLGNLDAYCEYLFEAGGMDAELTHLISAMSTNKTDFFREPNHFEFLEKTALPRLLEAGRRDLKLWSAAASIGAEAYSLAMVLEDFRRQSQGPDYAILATDINTGVLATAKAGRYPTAMLEPVPKEMRRRYLLQPRDPNLQELRIVPQLRAKVTFTQLNLMDGRYRAWRDMDFIFCRNVLIYFERHVQTQVLRRLCAHLRPGGYLILGHAESGAAADLPLEAATHSIYRKV